ncbi:MAG: sulfatase [Bacteroidales bacterium]|nr:sulfatase [Bacteroidales bacterium]
MKVLSSVTSISIGLLNVFQLVAQKAPNILYIMSDDHSSEAISCYGGKLKDILPTPNIDRIGNEGIRFENAFCTNSISTPSRAVILTGKYSHKNGVYTLKDRLDPHQNNIAKIVQANGYQTAIIGKWHLGSEPQGFDYYSIFPAQGVYQNPDFYQMGDKVGTKFEFAKKLVINGYCDDIIASQSIDWMKGLGKNKPFMLMCQFKAPHRPWQFDERFKDLLKDVKIPEPSNMLDTYKGKGDYVTHLRMGLENLKPSDLKTPIPEGLTRDEQRKWAYQIYMKEYLRCVAGVDENVGRLLDYLDQSGLSENTIVIYTSDQGFYLGEHGWFDKRFMFEESLHSPLLIRYPKEIKPHTVNKKNMVLNLDFAPTLLDLAGIKPDPKMQGKSFRSLFSGKEVKNWRNAIYYRYWMHNDEEHHVPGHYGIRTQRYKLIFFYNKPLRMSGSGDEYASTSWELYDLHKDPLEMNNLYKNPRYKTIIKNLKSELINLKKEYDDEDNLMNESKN